jgi:hypothetical protein
VRACLLLGSPQQTRRVLGNLSAPVSKLRAHRSLAAGGGVSDVPDTYLVELLTDVLVA